ncbi:hypothetical protein AKJ09_10198 [Labilithrix luteola]|uniref:Uncharacterized protein n=1 Tax=Labilithrix luteola TaxID=1391654 RepID=A0A0K1QDM2_9BACT|nr:hypothetical protein AKJ09_10198 [Labilithrix luteola]
MSHAYATDTAALEDHRHSVGQWPESPDEHAHGIEAANGSALHALYSSVEQSRESA